MHSDPRWATGILIIYMCIAGHIKNSNECLNQNRLLDNLTLPYTTLVPTTSLESRRFVPRVPTTTMVAFEPSTWAEVEEAQAMGKAALRATNPLVADIVRFTDAPERCITEAAAAAAAAATSGDDIAAEMRSTSPMSDVKDIDASRQEGGHRLIRAKRSGMHFEDVLRLGRVDLQTRSLIRRRSTSTTTLQRSLVSDASRPISSIRSALNPSSPLWNANDYLRTLHAHTGREELEAGLRHVEALVSSIDDQSDALRLSSFPSVCLVAAELRTTRKLACTDTLRRDDAAVFSRAELTLARTYADVTTRQAAVTRLRRVLRVLERFDWVFSLGARMRAAHAAPYDALERLAREYARGREWVDSQRDAPGVRSVYTDLSDGVAHLANYLTDRLGTPSASRVAMKRIVAVLAAIDCEGHIKSALGSRMSHARAKLRDCCNADEAYSDASVANTVKSATVAFLAGLSVYWRLAIVVSLFESCAAHVHTALPAFVGAYVDIIDAALARSLPRDAIVEVLRAHSVATVTLKVPKDYVLRLRTKAFAVATDYIKQCATAVHNSAKDVAAAVADGRIHPKSGAHLVHAVVAEALTQAEDVVRRRPADDESVHQMRRACARAYAEAASALHKHVDEAETGPAGAARALQAAVFCANANLDEVRQLIAISAPDDALIEDVCASTNSFVDQTRNKAVHAYVYALAPALEVRATRLVDAYAGLRNSTSPSAATDNAAKRGVSPAAVELVLEVALAALDARRRGAGDDVATDVAGELVSRVGTALRDAASKASLAPHHAKLVRTDCEFLAVALTGGRNSDSAFAKAASATGAADRDVSLIDDALQRIRLIRLCLVGDVDATKAESTEPNS